MVKRVVQRCLHGRNRRKVPRGKDNKSEIQVKHLWKSSDWVDWKLQRTILVTDRSDDDEER